MSEIICECCSREDDCIPRMLCSACHKNLTGIAKCCASAQKLKAKNNILSEAIKAALRIRALWQPIPYSVGNPDEDIAISLMAQGFEQALKESG